MMKNRNLKNALLGIALAVVAAYLFAVAVFALLDLPNSSIAIDSMYALLYTSWIVVPLGVALGMLIPQMAMGKTRLRAGLQGAGYGAIAGFVAVLCFVSVFRIWAQAGGVWIAVMAYCALWVGAYAFCRAKGQSLYR